MCSAPFQYQTVGVGHVADEKVERPVRPQTVDTSRRVVQARLPLVREVQSPVGAAIVRSSDALNSNGPLWPPAAVDLHPDQSAPVIGDQQGPVPYGCLPFGSPSHSGDEGPLGLERDAENAAVGNVDDVEMALVVERGTFLKCRAAPPARPRPPRRCRFRPNGSCRRAVSRRRASGCRVRGAQHQPTQSAGAVIPDGTRLQVRNPIRRLRELSESDSLCRGGWAWRTYFGCRTLNGR